MTWYHIAFTARRLITLTLAHTQQKAPPLQAGALADERILPKYGQAR